VCCFHVIVITYSLSRIGCIAGYNNIACRRNSRALWRVMNAFLQPPPQHTYEILSAELTTVLCIAGTKTTASGRRLHLPIHYYSSLDRASFELFWAGNSDRDHQISDKRPYPAIEATGTILRTFYLPFVQFPDEMWGFPAQLKESRV